ncbi:MAG: hypothetical protein AABZ53_09290 [Planctomycetota bacterium]
MKNVLLTMGVLAMLAGRATADPATIVNFSWSTTGITSGSASATCLTPPENHCEVVGGCSAETPTFALGGSSMANTTQAWVMASSGCSFGCNCCSFGGGHGSGDARSDYTIIEASSSTDLTQWGFSDRLYIGGRATANTVPGCVTGSGSGLGLATYEFDLVFETTSTTRLILTREHYVNVLTYGSAISTYTLSRVLPTSATLFTQEISSADGDQDGSGQTIIVLTPGTYNVHIEGQGEVAASASGEGSVGGSVEVWFGCSMRVESYECPAQTDAPDDVMSCVGQNPSFSVAADGTSVFYQWRRNGVPLEGGLTPAGTTTYGQWTPYLTIVGVKSADAGLFDCVLTNECGSVTSDGAELSVCAADFNCDTAVDFFDYDDYVVAFELGDPRTDFDADGSVDFFDYDAFVVAFELGC